MDTHTLQIRTSVQPLVLSLVEPATPEALLHLRSAASAAFTAGAQELVVDLDGLASLDSTAIAALVSVLRAAREVRASISLRASRPTVLETLRITALDKIFTVIAGELPPPPLPAKPRAKRRRFAAGLAALVVAASAFGVTPVAVAADRSPRCGAGGVLSTPHATIRIRFVHDALVPTGKR